MSRKIKDIPISPLLENATDNNVGTKLSTNLASLGTDCISRQAAIKAFNTNIDELVVSGKENADAVERYINRVLDAIKQLPPIQPEPHWIPVTERLPESKEEDLEYPTVLICFENEEIMLGCFYESTKEWGTGEYFDKKCDPIAWMPLPEPFKGVTT